MNRFLVVIAAIVALLVATNPNRQDLNEWIQSYIARIAADQAAKHPDNAGLKMAALFSGLVASAIPVERSNYLVFSIFEFQLSEKPGHASCRILGVAGQFVPFGEGCNIPSQSTAGASQSEALSAKERGDAAYGKGEYDRAIQDFSEAIRLNPQSADAFVGRGKAFLRKGAYDLAIKDFNEAIRLEPNSDGTFVARGLAYLEKGEFDRAIEDENQAIRLNPKSEYAFLNRGWAYHRKGDLDRAIADYSEAIRLNPDLWHAFNNRGNAYLARRDYERAKSDHSKGIALQPRNAVSYANRCLAHLLAGEADLAISDCTKAISLKPDYAFAFGCRGRAQKDQRRAMADFSEAIRLDPNVGEFYMYRGFRRVHSDPQGAISDLEQAGRLGVDDESMAYLAANLGLLGRLDSAIEIESTRIRKYPNPDTLSNKFGTRALWLLHKRDYVRALADLDEAIRLDPRALHGEFGLRALVNVLLGRYPQAIQDADKELLIRPTEAGVFLVRGTARLRSGDEKAGRADIATARRYAPRIEDGVEWCLLNTNSDRCLARLGEVK